MIMTDFCAECVYRKQAARTDDAEYLRYVRERLDSRGEKESAPFLVYLFNQEFARRGGRRRSWKEVRKSCNDLTLRMEDALAERIRDASDPLAEALLLARIGNYIDFSAQQDVSRETFLRQFDASFSEKDLAVYASFLRCCETGRRFLLLADNSGEIVLDKLFVRTLKARFPHLDITVMVRGGDVSNDALMEDAEYVGLTRETRVISSGKPIAGTVPDMLSDEAREALDRADVILAKGQGNYETLSGWGYHVFYAFLCKCEAFTTLFGVPELTGMLIEENRNPPKT